MDSKKVFGILVLLLSATFTFAEGYNVSTEKTKKNVLIEDFTGIYCPNCPSGHQMMEDLMYNHPGKINCMSIHWGSYARPHASDPDFRTEDGTVIADFFSPGFFPSGVVNRQEYEGEIVLGRGDWGTAARYVTHEDAPVNIYAHSIYNKVSNTVEVDVELCYTSEVAPSSSSLNIALTQSNIMAVQEGPGITGLYQHNHVLRDYITPVWGDAIEETAVGNVMQCHYEYAVPDEIKGITVDPRYLDVVVFVTDVETKNVLNVETAKVEHEDYSLPLNVKLESYGIVPVRNYGYDFIECYLRNQGTEPITSARFLVTLNDETETVDWTGDIEGLTRGYVRLPVDWSGQESENDYSIKLTHINGNLYDGGTLKGSFNGMLNVNTDLTMKITTDNFADDNTFLLLNKNAEVVKTYGPYAEGTAATYDESIHFEEKGIYCFEIQDEWGNGILSPRGSVKWYDATGKLIAQNTEIKGYGYRIFFKFTGNVDAIEIVEADTEKKIYNLQGQRVADVQRRGIYIINGKKQIIK